MLNQILTLGICLASGSGLLDVREPNRVAYTDEFQIVNGCDFNIEVEDGYTEERFTIPANSTSYITYDTTHQILVYAPDYDFDNDATTWAAWFDGADIPFYPEWRYATPRGSSFVSTPSSSNTHGFGLYYEKPIPTNVDYYIDTSLLGGVIKGISSWTGDKSLMPEGSYIRLYKDDGSYAQLNNLWFRRVAVENGINYLCTIYTNINANQKLMIANNYGARQEYFTNFSIPTNVVNSQPYMKYYNGYTNRIRFTGGYFPKYPQSPNGKGYQPIETWALTTNVTAYQGYSEGGVDETVVSITTGMGLVASSFISVSQFFNYMIFPGLSLGLLLCIPLIMTLILAIIKIIKKG